MTTTQGWIDEVKRHLLGGAVENLNRLDGAITNVASTLVYEFPAQGGISPGAIIEIDLELIYVWSVDTVTLTATVQRGVNGTTAAAHSDGALITVAPKFPQYSILTALNQELWDLCSPVNGLYRIATETLTTASGTMGYNFDVEDFLDVYEVHYEADAAMKFWKRVDNWRLIHQADTTDFASGRALIVSDWVGESGGSLHVTLKRAFDQLATVADDVETVTGMPGSMHDIPPLGAMVRLTATRGIKRVFDEAQGEPRRAGEVSEQGMIQNSSAILSLRRARIGAESARLRTLYPTKTRQATP